jgi:hypothetical protein
VAIEDLAGQELSAGDLWVDVRAESVECGMKIALKANNGMYIAAEQGGGIDTRVQQYPPALVANRGAIGAWETFETEQVDDTHIALKTCDGFYVTAEGGGGSYLRSNERVRGVWETFGWVAVGAVTSLVTHDGVHMVGVSGPESVLDARHVWQGFAVEVLDAPHLDPSEVSLRTIAAVRGAMWTVRGPWRYGPRPNDPSNVTALEYLYSYGNPYDSTAVGGAFNLNDEQRGMLETYGRQGYTHCCIGPVTAQSYRGHYPDHYFNTPETFEAFLDWLECFWNHGLCPIVFLHPDNWDLAQTKALYDPLIRDHPRAQQLMRAIVPSGWEPAYYNWSSNTWKSYMQWGHELLPNALILLHTVPNVDAPGGTDEAGDDNGVGNDKVWHNVAPHIHGWLHQSDAFASPDEIGDPNHPENTNYDNWAALFDKHDEKSFYNRFHNGYAGWPTTSLWGNEPIYVYGGEFCSYWNYHDNRAYEEGCGWGDRCVSVGADGYLDSGAGVVPERPAVYTASAGKAVRTVGASVQDSFRSSARVSSVLRVPSHTPVRERRLIR